MVSRLSWRRARDLPALPRLPALPTLPTPLTLPTQPMPARLQTRAEFSIISRR